VSAAATVRLDVVQPLAQVRPDEGFPAKKSTVDFASMLRRELGPKMVPDQLLYGNTSIFHLVRVQAMSFGGADG
jgi:hypothetical protein